MAKINKEVVIRAAIEKIFSYISEPSNLPIFWPSLIEVNDIQSLPNGGYRTKWVYKMAGMRFEGVGEYTEVVPNHWLVIETKGGIKSKITWTFRKWMNVTKVNLTIEYKIPIPLLGRLAEVIVTQMNSKEGDLLMDNLRTIFGG